MAKDLQEKEKEKKKNRKKKKKQLIAGERGFDGITKGFGEGNDLRSTTLGNGIKGKKNKKKSWEPAA